MKTEEYWIELDRLLAVSELLSETITDLIKSGQLIRVGNKPYKTTATLYRRVK